MIMAEVEIVDGVTQGVTRAPITEETPSVTNETPDVDYTKLFPEGDDEDNEDD